VSRQALDELKQQIPLLDYLQAQDWRPARHLSRGRLMGLCPLHSDHKSSFLVDPSKSLFYCYGCGRGGDVIRFVELYRQVKFPRTPHLCVCASRFAQRFMQGANLANSIKMRL
jgi:DNA primase